MAVSSIHVVFYVTIEHMQGVNEGMTTIKAGIIIAMLGLTVGLFGMSFISWLSVFGVESCREWLNVFNQV